MDWGGGGSGVEKATKRNHRFRKCWWGMGIYAGLGEGWGGKVQNKCHHSI
jgi:hypothetical protein